MKNSLVLMFLLIAVQILVIISYSNNEKYVKASSFLKKHQNSKKVRVQHKHKKHRHRDDPPEEEKEGEEGGQKGEEGPGEVVANGIEITITEPPLMRCSQSIGTKGQTVIDKNNYCKQGPGDLLMNFYNVNLFGDMADPATLKESIEWGYVDFPIKTIEHMPNCIHIQGTKVNKEILFCFENETLIQPWMEAVQAYRFCKKGIDPEVLAGLMKEAMAECMEEFTKKLLGEGAGENSTSEKEPIDPANLPSMGEAQSPEAKGDIKKNCKGCKTRRLLRRR